MTGLLAIVLLSTLILSGSRGGIVSFAFEIGVLALLAHAHKGPEVPSMASLAIVALAAVALVAWIRARRDLERFTALRPGEDPAARRVIMLRATLRIYLDHLLKRKTAVISTCEWSSGRTAVKGYLHQLFATWVGPYG